MARWRLSLHCKLLIGAVLAIGSAAELPAQAQRNVKVVLETQHSGSSRGDTVQGSGGIVIGRGRVDPSGRISADERQITFKRSGEIFTLVRDGGESILTVAARVPQNEIAYYYSQALGVGAIDFIDAATDLIVPDGQPVSLGGSTSSVREITRQILGYRNRDRSDETSLVITATVQ